MSDLCKLLRAQEGFRAMKEPTSEQLHHAEVALQSQFADDYRDYITAYGAVSFCGHELTGLCASPRLDVVAVTRRERENDPSVPPSWYVVEQANIDGIVIWQDASGAVYQTCPGEPPQRLCGSLCEYIEQY